MGAILSLPFRILNLLLPFTRAGTPLSQDVLHAAVLCGTLYYAPQITAWYAAQQQQQAAEQHIDQAHNGEEEEINATHAPHQAQGPEPRNPAEDLPFDERLVLQDDGEGDPHPGRPPRAPTPPPHEDHHQHGDLADAFAPGPANPPPNPSRNNRVVGTKKAKAIRRRNEERQYNEWIREQAQVRRLQDEEGREEREAALAVERERRAVAEEIIRQKEREEREALKKEREREAEEEAARRERVVAYVRDGMAEKGCVDLVEAAYTEGKDRTWVERLIRASGLLQQLQQESSHVMFTGRDWLVRIDQEVMARAYAEAERFGQDNGGKVGFEDFGGMLEKALLARANV
ncbi:Adeno-PV multi-domain protein [Pyrenophora tritici-repentis]|uniref:Adeno-PV multi-domain protein n=2 Tax=Pyrenophora tritici-repentis TaxID=45151 RepID=A0A922NII3_9PLEO|nr:uncharacterized protein PTRG_10585 [Pyrenophora tritici-repentis Pt-1C-BFP]EDU43635.1 predicted protein [Pyrenophora tritici-repentis Pt-1C-BFP]KAI1516546.1 Adeno-PV multi-domain protein [Pyrenophora tritici-repentis]KAI1671238.1 Adeno-PV multi-domain protein [Pyrenophora tritici-repentis]KAI1684984.1 Adeno-PV multi-domain protein [Pyrenophora tritici-repentis]